MLKNDKVSFKEVEDLENKYSDAVVKLLEIFEENEKKKKQNATWWEQRRKKLMMMEMNLYLKKNKKKGDEIRLYCLEI